MYPKPSAWRLTTAQRRLALADAAFRAALQGRVQSADRFAAFMARRPSYRVSGSPCRRCGDTRKRPYDGGCYPCNLRANAGDWQAMRQGIAPSAKRSRDGHLDVLAREKRERGGENVSRTFPTADPPGHLTVTIWPTGRTSATFPDGHHEPDLSGIDGRRIHHLCAILPELGVALSWAGWW